MLLSRLVTFIDCKERVNERPTCGSVLLLVVVQESLKGKHKTHTLKKHSFLPQACLPACLHCLALQWATDTLGDPVGDRHTGRSSGLLIIVVVTPLCVQQQSSSSRTRELELSWSLNFKKAASASE